MLISLNAQRCACSLPWFGLSMAAHVQKAPSHTPPWPLAYPPHSRPGLHYSTTASWKDTSPTTSCCGSALLKVAWLYYTRLHRAVQPTGFCLRYELGCTPSYILGRGNTKGFLVLLKAPRIQRMYPRLRRLLRSITFFSPFAFHANSIDCTARNLSLAGGQGLRFGVPPLP